MWTASFSDKKAFLEYLGNSERRTYENIDSFVLSHYRLLPENILAFWNSDPSHLPVLPNLLLVANGEITDFLAWSSTFLVGYRPLTAHCRVLEQQQFKESLEESHKNSVPLQIQCAMVGTILAEVLVSQSIDAATPITYWDCAGTFSFAAAKAHSMVGNDGIQDLYRRWEHARRLTKQADVHPAVRSIQSVWRTLLELTIRDRWGHNGRMGPAIIVEACRQIADTGEVDERTWNGLIDFDSELMAIKRQMVGTVEQRVLAFEAAFVSLSHRNKKDQDVLAFALGYLASLVAPGSMKHVTLISQTLTQFSAALFWYGACAGLYPVNDVLTSFSSMGRRILRDIDVEESLIERPRADMSLEELDIYRRGDNPIDNFPRTSPIHLEIEIDPTVTSVFHFPERRFRVHSNAENVDLIRDLQEMGASLNKAYWAYQRFIKDKAPPSSSYDSSAATTRRDSVRPKTRKTLY